MKTYTCLTNIIVVFPVDILPLQWWGNSQNLDLYLPVVFVSILLRALLAVPRRRAGTSYNTPRVRAVSGAESVHSHVVRVQPCAAPSDCCRATDSF